MKTQLRHHLSTFLSRHLSTNCTIFVAYLVNCGSEIVDWMRLVALKCKARVSPVINTHALGKEEWKDVLVPLYCQY